MHYGEEGRCNAPSAVVVCHGEEGAPHLPSPLCAIVRRELRALPPCPEPWGGSGGGFAMATVGVREEREGNGDVRGRKNRMEEVSCVTDGSGG